MINQVLIENKSVDEGPEPTITSYKVYKIRNKKTGLFSDGSGYVYWEDKGREWRTLASLGTHLMEACKYKEDGIVVYGFKYGGIQEQTMVEDIEVVSYDRVVTTKECQVDSGPSYVSGVLERRKKRITAEARRRAKANLVQAKKEFKFAQEKLNKLKG
jgi:hypothetical protein